MKQTFTALRRRPLVSGFIGSVVALSGCSDNDFVPPPQPVQPPAQAPAPPGPPANPETLFGAGFEAAFTQNADAAPLDPAAGDVIDLDLTADPIDIADPN